MFTEERDDEKRNPSGRYRVVPRKPPLPPAVRTARALLRERGWSYRSAATQLGRTYQHLSEVLNGHRVSARLLTEISQLSSRNAKP
jgi:hypothetical protein